MHKRATWIVVGFVAVVVFAATLDAVFLRSHAPASTRGTTSEASVTGVPSVPFSAAPPPCRPNQLELTINGHGPPPPRAPHDDYVSLDHARGGVCSFSGLMHLQISTREGPGQGVLRIAPLPKVHDDVVDLTDADAGSLLGGHLVPFRYSPKCSERGPFLAHVRVGAYAASRTIRVFRCGIMPPAFR
jgi:hypothetical protein